MALVDPAACEFPTTHPDLHCVSATATSQHALRGPSDADRVPRYAYLMANAANDAVPYNAVVRTDRSGPRRVYAAPGYSLGEPVFAPRAGTEPLQWYANSAGSPPPHRQDDGYVIVQAFAPSTGTEFHVLDARWVEAGPVCILAALAAPGKGLVLPNGFHGTWSRTVLLSGGSGARDAIPAGMVAVPRSPAPPHISPAKL
jgi:carotenoid cleavage dioxygenase-like enzyme